MAEFSWPPSFASVTFCRITFENIMKLSKAHIDAIDSLILAKQHTSDDLLFEYSERLDYVASVDPASLTETEVDEASVLITLLQVYSEGPNNTAAGRRRNQNIASGGGVYINGSRTVNPRLFCCSHNEN